MTTYTLVFDTETTGLPPRGNRELSAQPWVIQLAAVLYRDSDRWPVGHFSTYVLPLHGDAFAKIPEEKFFVENKLTAEHITPIALPLETSLRIFQSYLRRAHRLVAHNMAFDAPRIRDCYSRVNASSDLFDGLPKFCTMESLTAEMRLPGKFPGKFKWPTLDEAYRFLVEESGFTNAHDAMVDVQACARVLHRIEDKGIPLFRCN